MEEEAAASDQKKQITTSKTENTTGDKGVKKGNTKKEYKK